MIRNMVVTLLVLVCCMNTGVTKETIVWYLSDLPPYVILKGDKKGEGISDRHQQFLIDALPGYQHVRKIGNYVRITNEIREHGNVCSVALFKTPEREKFTEFSLPYVVLLTNKLVVKKEHRSLVQKYLTDAQTVNLDSLLQSGSFSVGVAKGRRYGGDIDAILGKYTGSPAIYERAPIDQFQGLLRMLVDGKRRINGIIGFPIEVQYLSEELNIDPSQFIYYEIGDTTPYVLGYVGCSRSDFGKTVIDQINQIVMQTRKTDLANFYEQYLNDTMRIKYKKFVEEAFPED